MILFQRQVRIEDNSHPFTGLGVYTDPNALATLALQNKAAKDKLDYQATDRTGSDVDAGMRIYSGIHTGVMDLIESFTGAKGARQAQASSLELARIKSENVQLATEQRSEGWTKVAPWIVGGVTVTVVALMLVLRKK